MTTKALISKPDAKRLAHAAKEANIAIQVKADGKEITFLPNIPTINAPYPIDRPEDIDL